MTMEDNNITTGRPGGEQPRHHRKPENNMLKVRNVLNVLFMLGAVVGVVWTLKFDRNTGIYIIGASMALKFIESAIRLLKL